MKVSKKLLTLIPVATCLVAITPFSFTSCNQQPEPEPDPDPEPEPETVEFDIQFNCPGNRATITKSKASTNTKFVAYVQIDRYYIYDSMTIKNGTRVLSMDVDYTFDPSDGKLTILAEGITEASLSITFNAKSSSGYEALVDYDTSDHWSWLMSPGFAYELDYVTKIVDSDTTKIITGATVKDGDGNDVVSSFDSQTSTLTILKNDIPHDTNLYVSIATSNKPPEDYLSERAFTLKGDCFTSMEFNMPDGSTMWMTASGVISGGTIWILDDATPDNNSDYNYYLGTNFHVVRAVEHTANMTFDKFFESYGAVSGSITGREYRFAFSDRSLCDQATGICDYYDDYIKFKSIEKEDDDNFMFNGISSQYLHPCCDFHVYKANLECEENSIINKLDKLNLQKSDLGYINKFVNGDDEEIKAKNKYIGGYPYRKAGSVGGGMWKYNAIENSGKTDYGWEAGYSHKIDEKYDLDFDLVDVCPGTRYDDTQDPQWMGGGASGSMVITSDYEVSGIYWGHWGSGQTYYPGVTFMKALHGYNSEPYDLVAPYLTGN